MIKFPCHQSYLWFSPLNSFTSCLKDFCPIVARLLRIDSDSARLLSNKAAPDSASVISIGGATAATKNSIIVASASAAAAGEPSTSFWRRKATSIPHHVVSEAAAAAVLVQSSTAPRKNVISASARLAAGGQRHSESSLANVSLPLPSSKDLNKLHVVLTISGEKYSLLHSDTCMDTCWIC